MWSEFALASLTQAPSAFPGWIVPHVSYGGERRCDFDGAAHLVGIETEALDAAGLLGAPTPEILAATERLAAFVARLDSTVYPPRVGELLSEALSAFQARTADGSGETRGD